MVAWSKSLSRPVTAANQPCCPTPMPTSDTAPAQVGRDLHPLPRAFMRLSTAILINSGERQQSAFIAQRYRSRARRVCDPRHACTTVRVAAATVASRARAR